MPGCHIVTTGPRSRRVFLLCLSSTVATKLSNAACGEQEVTNIDQLDTNMKALDAKALVDSSSAMLLGAHSMSGTARMLRPLCMFALPNSSQRHHEVVPPNVECCVFGLLLGYNLGVDSKDTRQLIKAKELDIVNAKIAAASSVQSNLSTSQKEIENALYGDLETLKVSLAGIHAQLVEMRSTAAPWVDESVVSALLCSLQVTPTSCTIDQGS